MASGWLGAAVAESFTEMYQFTVAVSLNSATPMCLTKAPRLAQPCRPCVTSRTLIGGSTHQTRNDSYLRELLAIASDLTGACRLPPAFIRPKNGEEGGGGMRIRIRKR